MVGRALSCNLYGYHNPDDWSVCASIDVMSPFIPAQEWSESALGENELGDSGQLYYNEDGGRGAGEVGVDDDWVQGLYDMEGMSGDTA